MCSCCCTASSRATATSLVVTTFQVGAFESALAGGVVAVVLTLLRHSREFQKLVGELEGEVGRSYLRLDARGRVRVDAFATDLRSATDASAAAMHLSPISDPANRSARDAELFKQLAEALTSLVATGDDLDLTFDTRGSAQATAAREVARRATTARRTCDGCTSQERSRRRSRGRRDAHSASDRCRR